MSNQQANKQNGTVFNGPLEHREEKLENLIGAKIQERSFALGQLTDAMTGTVFNGPLAHREEVLKASNTPEGRQETRSATIMSDQENASAGTVFNGPLEHREEKIETLMPEKEHTKKIPTQEVQPQDLTATVFMGPLEQREEKLINLINNEAIARWNQSTELTYMENVRTKATAKVRGMLLQAKKRSDQIVAEAEQKAEQILSEANAYHAQAQELQQQAQVEFDNVYTNALEQAQANSNEQLANDQKSLGESTAVVLLTIHQQLEKFYDAWREDLRLLTLEAIQVGTGWIATEEREQILSSMLDECVKKLIEKKDYVVRVHPTDGALVTQVLENSREKSWRMEVSKELEPGSLEIESAHGLITSSSTERKKFVQDILDNLILPVGHQDHDALEHVTETLRSTMQENPLLAKATQESQAEEVPLPDQEFAQAQHEENAVGQDFNQEEDNMPSIDQPLEQEYADMNAYASESPDNNYGQYDEALQGNQDFSQDNAVNTNTSNADFKADANSSEAFGTNSPEQYAPEQYAEEQNAFDPSQEAENLAEEFLSDIPQSLVEDAAQAQQEQTLDTSVEAPHGVQAHENTSHTLPEEMADDLLSEMGFDVDNEKKG